MIEITDHLADIERRIAIALDQSGRAGETITIVGVSKTQPPSAVRAAASAGISHFGENYLQEAMAKIAAVDDPALQWHFIGRIQSNKTRQIAEHFDWVETVDRPQIADRLSTQRPANREPLNVLIQLNLHGEPQKGGVNADGLMPLAAHISQLPGLRLRGVMSIPPAGLDPEGSRAGFLAVRDAALRLRQHGFPTDTLSMGMSADFELAIACGATSVRIGTALFGERRRGQD